MAGSRDAEKRRAWETRLARYHASELSVSRFCEQEGVSPNTFYYWAKCLRAASGRKSPRAAPASRPTLSTTDRSVSGAVVRFRWKTGVEVSVPADCLDAIRCLAESLAKAGDGRREAFQEVVVKA